MREQQPSEAIAEPEAAQPPVICIYHAPCADGFTAAWVVSKTLGRHIEYYPGVYGDAPPDVAGKHVLLVDFSYKRPVLEEMAKIAVSVLVLDHHKTAAADLEGYPPAQFDRTSIPSGIEVLFDMSRSGAQIAWDFFNPNARRPLLVDYVGDRDLWKFEMPSSREVNAYVFANDYMFDNWDALDEALKNSVEAVAERGAAIEKKHHKDVREGVNTTRRTMMIGGYMVPVANMSPASMMISDAANLMAVDQPFAACYYDSPKGRFFSLRSTAAGEDVSEIAKKYGGGGHRNAAGFQRGIGWEGDQPGDQP